MSESKKEEVETKWRQCDCCCGAKVIIPILNDPFKEIECPACGGKGMFPV